jgi:hypothetical protein
MPQTSRALASTERTFFSLSDSQSYCISADPTATEPQNNAVCIDYLLSSSERNRATDYMLSSTLCASLTDETKERNLG